MIPNSAPPPWPAHPEDDLLIVRNIAQLDAEIQGALGHREDFSLALLLAWHQRIHEGCSHIPVAYYVGHFRGEMYVHLRNHNVGFNRFSGAPAGEVEAQLAVLERQIQATLTRFDGEMCLPGDATKSRLNKLIDELTKHYAGWLRIHPFVDGNGRTARILANWVLSRYWQPIVLPGRPPEDKAGLLAATAPALAESGADYRPLGTHLRKRLWAARKASMVGEAPQSTP